MEKSAKSIQWQVPFFFALAFAVWIYCFWGFLTSRFALTSDALSYYDHIKFFVESLSRGVFPLWDPLFNGISGASNEFFLRRIGPYNPLYVLMAFCIKIGLPYRLVYLWGMSFYYFSGVVALYLCAMQVYQNRAAAYSGSMVLLFSTLGTRIFDSYMILIVVPLIWFSYFTLIFLNHWKRWSFIGLILCAGILLTTYIPLYSIVFILICFFVFAIVYPYLLKEIFLGLVRFLCQNKLLAVGAILLLVLSMIPTMMFAHSASQSQVVIPGRHGDVATGDQLQVGYHLASDWGIPEDLFYSSYFSNLKRIRLAVVYFPIFVVCVLLLGLANPLRRTTLFIFLSAFVLLSIFVPHLFPVHAWLFNHVSFFKYFRNLHFFLWFMLMPLTAFFVSDQMSGFYSALREKRFTKLWVGAVHLGLLGWLIYWNEGLWVNYISIILSFFYFMLCAQNSLNISRFLIPLVFVVILIQPVETYKYFSRNVVPYTGGYEYDNLSMKFKFMNDAIVLGGQRNQHVRAGLYVAPYWYNYFHSSSDDYDFNRIIQYRLTAYDQEKVYSDINQLSNETQEPMKFKEDSDLLKVAAYNANELSLITNFKQKKFLVYHDSYDPLWSVFVNDKPVQLHRAEIAFKGVWVPEGMVQVTFKYGRPWQFVLNFGLIGAYAILLALVLWLKCRNDHFRTV